MASEVIDVCYLLAASMFIIGLKGLTRPRTAVRGNQLAAAGMLLAVIATVFHSGADLIMVPSAVAAGACIGAILASRIDIKAMPELVALFNGLGGGASMFVAGGFLVRSAPEVERFSTPVAVATAASGIIGALTLTGSLVAFGKLRELTFIKDVRFTGQQSANMALLASSILCGVYLTMHPDEIWLYWLMAAVSLALGVLLVIPIGGADMPVVIALLNSFSGLAAAATGFVLANKALIIAGSLVGASGLILTRIMCDAMNRSLGNVLFGNLQPSGTNDGDVYATVKSTSAEEAAMILESARRVAIIPGYGMAVAQAQHAVRDLATALQKRGVAVDFGIHPVAGRMPGHMNVLLAEADIPYESLKEMDEINTSIDQIDVVIVLGANDVVNPLARTDPTCPIAGMPIINADQAKTVVVIKRSLSPGFAGIPNPLFAASNTLMLFADAKQAVRNINQTLNQSSPGWLSQ